MNYKVISAAVTRTGRRRNNQDNFILAGRYAALDHDSFASKYEGDAERPFFASVCDGMGGESSGETASYLACTRLAELNGMLTGDFEANKQNVTRSILDSNAVLCDEMQRIGGDRMGSTVAAALIQNMRLFYTNLGDSRIYLMRNGAVSQLTKDQTEGQSMVDAGVLTPEQLKTHPSRNMLSRHLGIFPEEMTLECAVYEDIYLSPDDKILICSDGVSGAVENDVLAQILGSDLSPEDKANRILDIAYENGSKDNMTAAVIEFRNIESQKTKKSFFPIIISVLATAVAVSAIFILIGLLKPSGAEADTTEPVTDAAVTTPDTTEDTAVDAEHDEAKKTDAESEKEDENDEKSVKENDRKSSEETEETSEKKTGKKSSKGSETENKETEEKAKSTHSSGKVST